MRIPDRQSLASILAEERHALRVAVMMACGKAMVLDDGESGMVAMHGGNPTILFIQPGILDRFRRAVTLSTSMSRLQQASSIQDNPNNAA